MRCAVIYRPQNPPPLDMMAQLMEGMSAWLGEYGSRFSTIEFFVGGGGFGVLDVGDSAELQRLIAANPFSPFSDVEIRPVVEPGQALQILQEAFAQASPG